MGILDTPALTHINKVVEVISKQKRHQFGVKLSVNLIHGYYFSLDCFRSRKLHQTRTANISYKLRVSEKHEFHVISTRRWWRIDLRR